MAAGRRELLFHSLGNLSSTAIDGFWRACVLPWWRYSRMESCAEHDHDGKGDVNIIKPVSVPVPFLYSRGNAMNASVRMAICTLVLGFGAVADEVASSARADCDDSCRMRKVFYECGTGYHKDRLRVIQFEYADCLLCGQAAAPDFARGSCAKNVNDAGGSCVQVEVETLFVSTVNTIWRCRDGDPVCGCRRDSGINVEAAAPGSCQSAGRMNTHVCKITPTHTTAGSPPP
jgi:hypothetical protein